jgi:hypothetical protein
MNCSYTIFGEYNCSNITEHFPTDFNSKIEKTRFIAPSWILNRCTNNPYSHNINNKCYEGCNHYYYNSPVLLSDGKVYCVTCPSGTKISGDGCV